MKIWPISSQSLNCLNQKEHICFGISPFNSYFTEEVILKLAQWGKKEFRDLHFFVPDLPAAYTLEALGYSSQKAQLKAKKQGQYIKNKIYRALKWLSIPEGETFEMILDWDKLLKHSQYIQLYDQAQSCFESDPQFKAECLRASRWVLEKHVPAHQMTAESLLQAVKYFLTELPLFANTASILKKKASVFCYYQSIPFLENLYQNHYSFSVAPNQGFIEVDINGENINHTSDKELTLRLDQSSAEVQIYDTPLR